MSLKPIAELGEFGLIEKIAALCEPTLGAAEGLQEGIGDDCAVYKLSESTLQVATTDLLVEQVHFDLLYSPLQHLGSKALSVNVSDVAAMNAKPRYALVSIALPPTLPAEAVEQLYKGMAHAAGLYGVALAGGDTSASKSGIVISVTAVGETSTEQLALRSGAREGDMVCVTGALGGSAAGLQLLLREKRIMLEHLENNEPYDKNIMANLKEYQGAIQCHLLPSARTDIIDYFHREGITPTAMIDISDGLSQDLQHLCRRSGTGAHIEEGRIPLHPDARHIAEEFQHDALDYALGGGEDYQLLFTLGTEEFQKIATHPDITVIGKITSREEGVKMSDIYGMQIDLADQKGFQHF